MGISLDDRTSWEAEVRSILLLEYDLDDSPGIDLDSEFESVPCDVLMAVNNRGIDAWELDLLVGYGLKKGSKVNCGVLGFDNDSDKTKADERIRHCYTKLKSEWKHKN